MFGIGKLKSFARNKIENLVQSFAYRVDVREGLGRKEFFYNAFKALSFNGIDGDYVEFGCHGGKTFALAYHESVRHGHNANLWGFDSFQGLPDAKEAKDSHPRWTKSAMSTSLDQFHELCATRGVPRGGYHVVPGFYDHTLRETSDKELPENIALAYVDCDLYSSTRDVLEFLMPRLKHGMIIAFDDYFCWSANQISGERMAMLELFAESRDWNLVPYMQFGWHGFSFIIEDRRLTRHIQTKADSLQQQPLTMTAVRPELAVSEAH